MPPIGLTQPPRLCLQHAKHDSGVIEQEALELRPRTDEAAEERPRTDVARRGNTEKRRDLAEEVSSPELRSLFTVDEDGRFPLEDDVEPAAGQALPKNPLVRSEDLFLERVCDRVQLGPAKIGEERELGETLQDRVRSHARGSLSWSSGRFSTVGVLAVLPGRAGRGSDEPALVAPRSRLEANTTLAAELPHRVENDTSGSVDSPREEIQDRNAFR
jgi:hypothetical protein